MFVYFLQVMLRWWWVRSRVKNSLYKCFIMMARGEKRPGPGPGCDHNGQLMNFNGHSLVTTSRALPVWGIINQITRLSKLFLSKMFPSSFLQGATSSVGRRSLGWQLFVGWLFLTAKWENCVKSAWWLLGVMMKITGLMVGYWVRGGVMGQAMIYSQLGGSTAIKIIRFQWCVG